MCSAVARSARARWVGKFDDNRQEVGIPNGLRKKERGHVPGGSREAPPVQKAGEGTTSYRYELTALLLQLRSKNYDFNAARLVQKARLSEDNKSSYNTSYIQE